MRKPFIFVAAAALLLAGCGDNSKPAPAVKAADDVVSAPVNYVGAVVQAQKQAEKVIHVSFINQAVQMFQASEGRLPKDLQELVPNYLAKIPAVPFGYKIVYNPATGTASVTKP